MKYLIRQNPAFYNKKHIFILPLSSQSIKTLRNLHLLEHAHDFYQTVINEQRGHIASSTNQKVGVYNLIGRLT